MTELRLSLLTCPLDDVKCGPRIVHANNGQINTLTWFLRSFNQIRITLLADFVKNKSILNHYIEHRI